jgi:hypothetical protein
MPDDGDDAQLGSPRVSPWPVGRPALFRLRRCGRRVDTGLQAIGSLVGILPQGPDPQPLPLIEHLKEPDAPWIWQCHVDLSSPNPAVWSYLRGFVEQYDSAVFSMPDYAQQLGVEQRFIAPAINPFSPKNSEMSDEEIDDCFEPAQIKCGDQTDRPLSGRNATLRLK